MGERIGLSDAEWEIVGALFPAERGRGSRPAQDNRRYFEGMMWIARTGEQWLFNKLKNWRRVATRYDKTAESYIGFVSLASAWLWLPFVHVD